MRFQPPASLPVLTPLAYLAALVCPVGDHPAQTFPVALIDTRAHVAEPAAIRYEVYEQARTEVAVFTRKQIRHVRQCLPAIERCHTGSRRVPAPCCRVPSSPLRFCLVLFRESHIEPDPVVGHDISP